MPTAPNRGRPGSSCPPTTRPRTSRRSSTPCGDKLPASARVLIVDDSSPDGTGEIADRLAAGLRASSVLHRPRKEGLGPAYVAGFRHALAGGAGLVVEMDSDFSHDPAYLPRLLRPPSGPTWRSARATSPAAGSTTGAPCGARSAAAAAPTPGSCSASSVRDLTGGFKCFRREVLEAIDLDSIGSRGYAFQVEMTYRAIQHGFRWPRCRSSSASAGPATSKMDGAIVAEAAWRVPALRFGGFGPVNRLLITGGAGFVGSNLGVGLAERHPDWEVVALDNLMRRGSELNLSRLREAGVEFVHGDVREPADLLAAGEFDAMLEGSAEPSVMAAVDGDASYSCRPTCSVPSTASSGRARRMPSSSSSRPAASIRSRRSWNWRWRRPKPVSSSPPSSRFRGPGQRESPRPSR